jgi:hypothetical protein
MLRTFLLGGLAAALCVPAAAQTLLAVTFPGQVLHVDAATGATTVLASGQLGKNCLGCTGENRFWTTVRSGTVVFLHFLCEIDPVTGAETVGPVIGDIRAMAGDGTRTGLFAIRNEGTGDRLVRIDTATGSVTTIGNTGFTGIQGLEFVGGTLKAWDVVAGEVHLDPATGVGTDAVPGVAVAAGLQWLASIGGGGALFVGHGDLQRAEENGATTLLVAFAGNPDVRGVEFLAARVQPLGNGCLAVNGADTVIRQLAPPTSTVPFGVRSGRYTAGALGAQIVGFSETTHAGQPLPIALDPLLGTQNCFLHTSIDLTLFAIADNQGLTVQMALPAGLVGFQFFVQHAVFDAVPGGIVWSPALRVRTAW